MKYIELSIKNTEEKSRNLAEIINNDFKPELIIFVAKGSFLIGNEISKYFQVPLIEVTAVREGNNLKSLLSPLLKIMPLSLKNFLRKRELKSGIHFKNVERNVHIEYKFIEAYKHVKNILIVDDSIDTGNTAKQVKDFVGRKFPNSEIKFACLNYFDMSRKLFNVDYNLFNNYILIGPWSKDSKYYKDFITRYYKWKEK